MSDVEDQNNGDEGVGGGSRDFEFVEETKDSYCGKLGDAFCGMCFGVFLFFGAMILLFWNEGRAVNRAKDLDEAQNEVVSVNSYGNVSVQEYQDQLIHVVGPLSTSQQNPLTDPIFGVSASISSNSSSSDSSLAFLKLSRSVSMYQWVEKSTTTTKKTLDGGTKKTTTYNYVKEWSSVWINSNNFRNQQSGNKNPSRMSFDEMSLAASPILLGNDFQLSSELLGYINWYQPIDSIDIADVPDKNLQKDLTPLPDRTGFFYHSSFRNTPTAAGTANATGTRFLQDTTTNGTNSDEADTNNSTGPATDTVENNTDGPETGNTVGNSTAGNENTANQDDNTTNLSPVNNTTNLNTTSPQNNNNNSAITSKPIPAVPNVGDSRITFQVVPADTVSIVAKYTVRGTLEASTTKRDGSILLFERGSFTAQEMFTQAEADNTTTTWILRVVGFFLMFVSVLLILQPISTAFDIIPFVGDMIGDGLECCIFPTIAFIISFPISCLVVAVAWLAYRPLIAFPLILVFGAIVGWLCWRGHEKMQEQQNNDVTPHNNEYNDPDIPVVTGVEAPQKYDSGGGGFANALDN